jgi:hypothetical protein
MSRPPPTAPMPKLSGTNSMPIGGRGNRFSGSASISPHPPLPPAPLPAPVTFPPRRGANMSGSTAQPVVSRSVRPASGNRESHERPVCCTSIVVCCYLLDLSPIWMPLMTETGHFRLILTNGKVDRKFHLYVLLSYDMSCPQGVSVCSSFRASPFLCLTHLRIYLSTMLHRHAQVDVRQEYVFRAKLLELD